MESKGVTSDNDAHNDTTEDVDGPSSDKYEIPCCIVVLYAFYLISMLYDTLDF